ncbi:unnamed protein product [Phytophthora lilii]|uniref:Unnamed protein product n=1 Tax=Phytophthora lilii TaxID=2077276 RepID=A0A9W6YE92_9STRA|nr:unnamed protein product [Phytophthora lilii]
MDVHRCWNCETLSRRGDMWCSWRWTILGTRAPVEQNARREGRDVPHNEQQGVVDVAGDCLAVDYHCQVQPRTQQHEQVTGRHCEDPSVDDVLSVKLPAEAPLLGAKYDELEDACKHVRLTKANCA